MVRGSTPTHTFELPLDEENIKNVIVAYAQDDVVVLSKTIEDCIVSGNIITLELSQEETLLFNSKKKVDIQLKVLNNNGKVFISNIICTEVGKCFIDEVIE